MGRGRRSEELLRVEGRCPQGGMGGGGWLQAAAAAAGGGLQCCAETVTAGKPESSKKGLVAKIKALILSLNLIRLCRLQPVVTLVSLKTEPGQDSVDIECIKCCSNLGLGHCLLSNYFFCSFSLF